MVDPNEHEMTAMASASDAGGDFIEKAGKTDMTKWTAAQWGGFIETICGAYVDSLCAQQASLNAAVAKVIPGPPGP